MSEWKPFSAAPKDGTPINVRVTYVQTMRFQPYKPNSEQSKRGKRGRWQAANEHGGWDNCDAPEGYEWTEVPE